MDVNYFNLIIAFGMLEKQMLYYGRELFQLNNSFWYA